MATSEHKVLLINSEIFPYLPETEMSKVGRYLPQGIQERRGEIRSFMPRYGCINERKNQLHEVIRLSGMNIIIDDVDHPLIIKVASISAARIQVYFIDNEDYFRRKMTGCDSDGKFFEDNDERAIFFARGVLETVKKLRWAPDIVHCQGWITQVVPPLLKKAYRDDPIFSSSKIVTSLCDDIKDDAFKPSFASKAAFGNLTVDDMPYLRREPDGVGLAKTAVQYSDGIIFASDTVLPAVADFVRGSSLPVLEYDKSLYEGQDYVDAYNAFYDSI